MVWIYLMVSLDMNIVICPLIPRCLVFALRDFIKIYQFYFQQGLIWFQVPVLKLGLISFYLVLVPVARTGLISFYLVLVPVARMGLISFYLVLVPIARMGLISFYLVLGFSSQNGFNLPLSGSRFQQLEWVYSPSIWF